ncbi:3-oxoacyl-ACP reductase [Allohahella marinimesophila]|uniref:3-oxoacyl-ACP reductase n=1 Tax=Allohahella marinimesophila TaxID=1054972 RepID=A0ABP7PL83_9GAMM
MTDFLLAVAQQGLGAKVLRQLGLPSPVKLKRGEGAYSAKPLANQTIGLIIAPEQSTQLTPVIQQLGGQSLIRGDQVRDGLLLNGIIVDANGCHSVEALRSLFEQLQAALPRLRKHGRILVLTASSSVQQAAAAAAFNQGFVGLTKSLAKEVGKRGVTVNLLKVDPGCQHRLYAPVAFFLGHYSSYITGQSLHISCGIPAPAQLPATAVLSGKAAVVTGAAGGIGAETAKRLASEGAHVICLDTAGQTEKLNALAADIGGTAIVADITQPEAAIALTDWCKSNKRQLDVIVHNAGITRDKTLARMSEKQWDAVLAVNLQAILELDAALLDHDLIAAEARVVCLSSISGIAGNYGQTNYAFTKAALIGYVKAQAVKLGSRGVTVNAVAPGFIETDMTASLPVLVREAGRRLNALSQGGKPGDVAEAIQFLVSPGASGISGQTLRVCGGSLLGA